MEEEYEFLPPPPPPPFVQPKEVKITASGEDVKISWKETKEGEEEVKKGSSSGSASEMQLPPKATALGVGECTRCGEDVTEDQQRLNAGDRLYHAECFTCYACNNPVSGKFFDMESRIYCEKDYNAIFVYDCAKCNEKIFSNSISHEDDVFHVKCFNCEGCGKNLVKDGKSIPFFAREGKLYCESCTPTGKECFSCNKEIHGSEAIETTPNAELGKIAFHKNCFTCGACNGMIIKEGSSSVAFAWRDGKPYHPDC